jgi:hypothetical protein
VLFFVSRGVTVDRIDHIQVPERVYYALGPRMRALTPKGIIENIFALVWCKLRIKELGSYTVFCHNNRDLKQNIFIRQKRCYEAHYFEDGVDFLVDKNTYQKKYPTYGLSDRVKAKTMSFISGSWGYKPYTDPLLSSAQSKVFVLTEWSLLWKNCQKEIVPMRPTPDIVIDEHYDIWIPSGLVKQGIVTENVYKQFWDYIATNHRFSESLYIKFHPAQSNNERVKIKMIALKYYKLVEEIDTTIEEVACMGNRTFIGCGSGLLAYSRLLNNTNKVYIGFKVLERINRQPTPRTDYWENLYSNDLYKDNII